MLSSFSSVSTESLSTFWSRSKLPSEDLPNSPEMRHRDPHKGKPGGVSEMSNVWQCYKGTRHYSVRYANRVDNYPHYPLDCASTYPKEWLDMRWVRRRRLRNPQSRNTRCTIWSCRRRDLEIRTFQERVVLKDTCERRSSQRGNTPCDD